jgi:hypothetical protein
VITKGTSVEVSDTLKSLRLQDRYTVDATVTVRSSSNKTLDAYALLSLEVDMPMPFRLTPKAVIETTGTAVVSRMVHSLMEGFTKSMVYDIEQLSSER